MKNTLVVWFSRSKIFTTLTTRIVAPYKSILISYIFFCGFKWFQQNFSKNLEILFPEDDGLKYDLNWWLPLIPKKKFCWNQNVKFIWEIHVVWIYGMVSKKLLKIKNTLLGWFLKWKFDHVDHSRISILVADFDSFQIFCGFKWFQQNFFFFRENLETLFTESWWYSWLKIWP